MSDERCALVLEGGAMRGMYTAGVLDCFMDHDISFDAVIGVSAGALFGVNLLSKQRGRVIRYNKRFNSDKNYMGIRPLLREKNIVSTKYAYDTVPRELDPFDDEEYKKKHRQRYILQSDVCPNHNIGNTRHCPLLQIRSLVRNARQEMGFGSRTECEQRSIPETNSGLRRQRCRQQHEAGGRR